MFINCNCLCPSLCPGQFMHAKCLWLWEFWRSPTFRVPTWRACSPSLSESWLAGQPRAALCSSTFVNSLPISLPASIYAHEMSVTLRVLKVTDISCAYMACMFAIAKWKLACWAATCSSLFQYFVKFTKVLEQRAVRCCTPLFSLKFGSFMTRRRPKFQREKRPRTAQCDVLVATTWALLKTICRDLLICHPTSVKAESTWSRWKKNKRLRRNVLKSSLQLLELCFLVWLGLGQCGLSDQLCIIPNSGKKRWKRHGWKSRNVV